MHGFDICVHCDRADDLIVFGYFDSANPTTPTLICPACAQAEAERRAARRAAEQANRDEEPF